MKTLQKEVAILYRFRCERCRSKFEMTEEEKVENDWTYGENGKDKYDHPHNPLNKFYCPVCDCMRIVMRRDMHKIHVMDDGTEVIDF